jgi:hypothetical protein
MDFTMEKPAFTQNNSRLHALPRYNPQKVLTFQELYPGRYAFPRYNPRKVLTFREKILNYYLTFIRGLIGFVSGKETRPKNLMLQSL